jgi:hypothetical protein
VRRTNNSSYKLKFKKLVLKVIRSQRIAEENSSADEEGNILAPYMQQQAEHPPSDSSTRALHHRLTCSGLENNFNKIE